MSVLASDKPPQFAVSAGPDRIVVLPAQTYLRGDVPGGNGPVSWRKLSGEGEVTFADPSALQTTAEFAKPGDYVLELKATNGAQSALSQLKVKVEAAPPKERLSEVPTDRWKLSSPFWEARLKAVVVNWIPHCIATLSEPGLKEGGFENFSEAAAKNAGRPAKPHVGPPWSDAYCLNTLESMCLALQIDAQDDRELAKAQEAIRAKLEQWIPVVLAAQEPDGYLQTRFTLGIDKDMEKGQIASRWTYGGAHEGYVAGYFLDAAVAHFWLTGGKDRRLYDGAKKLADCWDANIGPAPKKTWFDGHEEMEQALVRLGRLVNTVEGTGKGEKYIQLAKFLLDARGRGRSPGHVYDQSLLPVTQQYEAAGHAVRAVYCYSGIADIALETRDAAYQSAARSLWSNIVGAKLYLTGGIGALRKDEAFGANYELPNVAYSESCAACGLLFFGHRMQMAYKDAHYADVMEDTLYNTVLGALDLQGKSFTYINPLDQTHARYPWHGCPCCIGNIPRTLLMLPTWMYAHDADNVFVNLYVGSTVRLTSELEIEQRTEYPWKGGVALVVNPEKPRKFALCLREPNRSASPLYQAEPKLEGIISITVNGKSVSQTRRNGYAILEREWHRGDTVQIELPLEVQRVRADGRLADNQGRVALRYGPLIYNFEAVDQSLQGVLSSESELKPLWEPSLLGGVTAICGKFADGSPLMAIPNYARNNRGGRSIVWIQEASLPPVNP